MRRNSRRGLLNSRQVFVCLLAALVFGTQAIAGAGPMTRTPAAARAPRMLDAASVTDYESIQRRLPDGSIEGTPIVGELGISETVAEIMARESATPREQDTEAEANAERLASTLSPQTPGTSFTGATLAGTNPSGAFPPDTMGAAGPSQFVVCVNGRIATFNKATGVADGALNATTDTFFNSVRNGSATMQPRVRYDRLSGRWFITMRNASVLANRVLIAVSSGPTIASAASFTFFFFASAGFAQFFDFPSLGIDQNALYIGGRRLLFDGTFLNSDAFVVRKSSLTGGGPIIFTPFMALLGAGISMEGPLTPQGVDNYDSAATEGYFIGVSNNGFGRLALLRVSNPGGTPTIGPTIPIVVDVTMAPLDVPHQGGGGGPNGFLDGVNDSLIGAHIRNDRLWTVHNIGVNSLGVAVGPTTRTASRWYELQNVASPGTPSVLQSGTVFDGVVANPLSFWMPSIMVSGQGHAAMGFSRAGANARADAATCGRLAGDPLGTMQTVTPLTASTTAYNPPGDPPVAGGRRWGRYSYTSLDPNDDMTMWTIQEFCDATNSWGVRVAQLLAPPPATPSVASPPQYAAAQPSFNVTVTGTQVSGSGFFDPGAGFPNRISVSVTGGVTVNSVTYVDPTHVVLNLSTVGASQGPQTVTITNPDGQSRNAAIFTVLAPSAVRLASFTATPGSVAGGSADGTVRVQWKTGLEVDNLGFNLYRETNGRRKLLTPKLIAGSALVSGSPTAASSLRFYEYVDTPPAGAGNVRYLLEDVDLRGARTIHGPIAVGDGGISEAKPRSPNTSLLTLSELGADAALGVATTPATISASDAEKTGDSGPVLWAQTAVKLSVRQDGWYRVTGADLTALGPRIDAQSLQLWADGAQIPVLVSGDADGQLDPADTVEFYGRGHDLQTTDTRVYWVIAGSTPGLRIKQSSSAMRAGTSPGFPYTAERKERLVYFAALLNGGGNNFFGRVVSSTPVDQPVKLTHIDPVSSGSAVVDVSLQGVTLLPHEVQVALNGTVVGTVPFTGMGQGHAQFTVPQSLLVEGDNVVQLRAVGAGFDVSVVDAIRITYDHSAVADADVLTLRRPTSGRLGPGETIGGFSTPQIRVIDISNPSVPVELIGNVAQQGGTYSVTVRPQPGTRALVAFENARALRPSAIDVNTPSNWHANAGADVVVIGYHDFLPALAPLVALRQTQGYSVAVVDIEDVYDEFGSGEHVPQALRAFMTYANASWATKPRFMVLAGGCSYDARDYFSVGQHDLVPTRLVDASFLEAMSDDWFVDFDDDGLPELAVGRLPARDANQAAAIVAKIVAYDASGGVGGALLVSDANDNFNYDAAAVELASVFPSTISVQQVSRSTVDDATARATVLSALNSGRRIVDWTGHGSVDIWRGNILTSEDAANLADGSGLALFTMMTCLNGYDADPHVACIGEAFVAAPNRGAIAVWASSAETVASDQTMIQREFYTLLFKDPTLTIGEAAAQAKAATSVQDPRRTWILLGDPLTKLR